jgi:hypothetical protein
MARFKSWRATAPRRPRNIPQILRSTAMPAASNASPPLPSTTKGRFVVGWQDDVDGDGKSLVLVRNFTY